MYTAGEQRYIFNNFLHRTITADKREYLILSCCRAVVRHLTPEGGGGGGGVKKKKKKNL